MKEQDHLAISACRKIAKLIGFDIKGKTYKDLVDAVEALMATKAKSKSKKG